MNIMLVTVTERTREIGIRKAVGAKKRHIFSQFLIESVVLTGFGGMMGRAIRDIVEEFLPSDSGSSQAPPPEPKPMEEESAGEE